MATLDITWSYVEHSSSANRINYLMDNIFAIGKRHGKFTGTVTGYLNPKKPNL